jgi:L-ascorbate metabolism protein UlaG (beta-lactamase superfamily)
LPLSQLTWLGHSTALLSISSVRLLTDPLLRHRVAHLRRVTGPPPLPEGIAAVLISHAHHDHLDPGSLRLLDSSTPIVVPRGAGRLLRRRGFHEVIELQAGDRVEVAGVALRATQALHARGRGPIGRRSPAIGYLIGQLGAVPDSWQVYFAGDTDLFEGMAELARRIEVALLPVSGWGRRLPPGHLDPRRAAEAAGLIGPRLAVPIHWGTLAPAWRLRDARDRSRAIEFEREAARLAPEVQVRVLEPGGKLAWDPG